MARKLKKDFDRDKMYSKIMPTSIPEPDYEPPEPLFVPEKAEAEESPPAPAPALRLHNYMEDVLLEKLPHTMKVLRCCNCDRCRMDVMALCVNELPAAYAVVGNDSKNDRVKELRREYDVKVTASLIKAIQKVKSEPAHGRAEPVLV